MKHETISITALGHEAKLHSYILGTSPELAAEKRPLVVLCPGGGYSMTSDREAEPVAMKFLAEGIHVCILRYTCAPARFPVAVAQAAKAVALTRKNAEEWLVDTDKIFIMGFSAGGHLAASLGVFWNKPFLAEATGQKAEEMKPNGMILGYPVITGGPESHPGSFDNLLGEEVKDPKKLESVSLEKQVSKDTSPAFIWHTFNDGLVPVKNSLLMMSALCENGVSFESHIYPNGPHGLSLANEVTAHKNNPTSLIYPDVAGWIDLATRWVKR